jgi:hypothetical protein
MAAQIFSLFGRSAAKRDWSQQEIAEFYRVESALIRAGIRIGSDRGISDEGDPWFVFFRAEDGEVVIHLARIDGEYVLAGSAYQDIARGADFNALVHNLIANHPLVRSNNDKKSSNILMHPAAMLIAIIGTAFFKAGDARADDGRGDRSKPNGGGGPMPYDPVTGTGAVVHVEVKQAVAILASVLMAMEMNADAAQAQQNNALFQPHADAPPAETDHGAPMHFVAPQAVSSDAQIAMIKNAAPEAAPDVLQPMLALIAVLKDLPAGQVELANAPFQTHAPLNPAPILAAATARESAATSGGSGEPEHAHHAAASTLDDWLIEISLKPESLPDILAVRLIKEVASDGGLEQVSLVKVDTLPSALAQLIASGIQIGDHDTHTGDAPNSDGDAPAQPPIDTSELATQPATPEVPHDPAPPADTGPGTAVPADINATISKYMAYFIAHSTDVEVFISGDDIVIVDDNVLAVGYSANVESVTFHLDDGSSISLVGQASVIHDTMAHFF